jgi:hypothetical protein
MRTIRVGTGVLTLVVAAVLLAPPLPRAAESAAATATDVGWPREAKVDDDTVTVYQPQLERWQGNQLDARSAVAVATPASPTPTYGVVWFTARTEVDKTTRLVTMQDFTITKVSFPSQPSDAAAYESAIRAALPASAQTIAIDRLEAALTVSQSEGGGGRPVEVQNRVPRIIFSETPAVLVLVDGQPALRPAGEGGNLMRIINTRALLLLDQSTGHYYLHLDDRWATAPSLDGPWTVATDPPAALAAAKDDAAKTGTVDLLSDSRDEAKAAGAPGGLPAVYVSTEPASLLQSSGKPSFAPVGNTQLLAIQNSSNEIFLDEANQDYYVLAAGRWFKGPSLTAGPWTFVPADALPAGFSQIPFDGPHGGALASVAHTPQAKEAVIASSIPQTASVERATTKMPEPKYDGAPKFQPVEGTSLEYAANTATPVIRADGAYWAVVNGVWFTSGSPRGPWLVAAAVPPVIYTIPPSSPLYYVTYVHVYGATPRVVYVGYTPGYYGTYVTPVGTVVYGTGWAYPPWIGSVWIGPPVTYGFGAGYTWGAFSGFALGFAAGAWCHPWWGPAGWGWGWGWGHTNVYVNRTVNVYNSYSHWGGGSVHWQSHDSWAGHTTFDGGNRYVGHVGNTRYAGTKGGDVYAGHDGNLYRRQSGGGWQKYDNGSWNDVNRNDRHVNTPAASSGGLGATEERGGERREGGWNRGSTWGGAGTGLGGLDREFQGRQLGDGHWGGFRQGGFGGRFGSGWGDGVGDGGERFGGGGRFGGGWSGGFGGRLGGGFGGGFRGGRR